MAYQVELRDEDGFVLVTHTGRIEPGDLFDSAAEAADAGLPTCLRRVLIDAVSITDLPEGAVQYADLLRVFEGLSKVLPRGALVVRPERVPATLFFAEVARHRGYAFGVFGNRDHALAWLLGDAGAPGMGA